MYRLKFMQPIAIFKIKNRHSLIFFGCRARLPEGRDSDPRIIAADRNPPHPKVGHHTRYVSLILN